MRGTAAPFPDYSEYSTEQLLAAFAAGPRRMRDAIAGLAEADLRARPRGPTKWSIHEIVIHTADSELQGAFRIRKAWSEPGPLLPIYDQDLWAATLDYQAQSAAARECALALLASLREHTLPLFTRATDADWAKWGTHPEFGPVTLRNILELYADHTERHIDQIVDSRERLGQPLTMEAMLARRLY